MNQSASVLIIDDSKSARLALREFVESMGHRVLEATHGEEGLEVSRRTNPDLVLTDLAMPEMGGLSFISEFKHAYPHIPVIVISGTGTLSDAIEAVRLGACDYLVKPIKQKEELQVAIGCALERVRLLDESEHYKDRLEAQVLAQNRELRESSKRFQRLLESVSNYVYTVTIKEGKVDKTVHRAGCEKITGFALEDYQAHPDLWYQMVFEEDRPMVLETARRILTHATALTVEHRTRHKDGSIRWVANTLVPCRDADGTLLSYDGVISDITKLKGYQEQLEFQANHDGLTNLPNRNLLTDRIRQALLIGRRSRQETALFMLDLDNFKLINDTIGHDCGDLLLKTVAERLCGCVRSGDTVARQGGDEFMVVISDIAVTDEAPLLAARLLEAVAQPLHIFDKEVVITASIGISIFPKDGDDVQNLVKNAEVAMYRAKEYGRNTFQFFTGEMNARSLARMTLEHHLRQALEREELSLHYQPKVHIRSGQISGMEALLRWHSPEFGTVPPATFIPLAEETGLIVPIGEWVLRTACAQNMAWQEARLPPLSVAVNLSPRQFRQQDIAGIVEKVLKETGLAPCFLELEITESMVMSEVDRVAVVLNELKRLGISLSMDDFGTGYSSLSYLKRFPFDKLKIDQSFVRDITCDPHNAAIAKAVIAMAHSLQMKVIAEGVETEGQLNYLRSHDCDEIQGYLFGKPVPPLEFERFLLNGRYVSVPKPMESTPESTLLVVDDEEDVARSLQRLFNLEGYRVLTATSVAQGFELLSLNRVGVIISDYRMPDMNGAEFLGRVKELYPETVRLVLSGYADINAVTKAINVGAIYKFLNKPWGDDEIREEVSGAFRHYHLMHGMGAAGPADGPRGGPQVR